MSQHGPWFIKDSNDVYVDPFVHVRVDRVIRPDGNDGQHVVVLMKPGVCVLAIDEENNVYLTREFHYGVGRYSLEAVSGGIDTGEQADATAKRELAEELGLIAECWEPVGSVDPFTTIVVSPTKTYIARGLTKTASNPEGTELIETVIMPLSEAVERVNSGEITHAPTCVLILQARMRGDFSSMDATPS
ncbi:NUDIX hydrolase [bacterium]|nr:NUDIX hydrolase [bacterium]MDA7924012.1 NUDIX hydrolase [Mariniblastus sp.]MDA7901871.1 NUDIX hydrolase [bacterium]MDA7910136.1 NUDIX hydrolase [bacterium]MDA7926288.1 NUDIX hydrolase [Mariniblastus sp.]